MKVQFKHTEESKANLSIKRKEWLKNNPDKHPWKRHDKFKSKPCENAKQFLRDNNIPFIEEYTPENIDRNYSIDIALPDKMISLEINGNQHYNRDGTLKPYYQERQDILEKAGWIVYQIHYSACFNLDKWKDFFNILKYAVVKVDFDYFTYVPKKLERKTLHDKCGCGNKKLIKSKNCFICNNKMPKIYKRKTVRPTKELLTKLIWEKPLTKIGKDFNVTDNAIRKWCKLYNITEFPKRGYWLKSKLVN